MVFDMIPLEDNHVFEMVSEDTGGHQARHAAADYDRPFT
jgi:hypothetical protein